MNFSPYENPNTNMLAILQDETIAERTLMRWLGSHFAPYQALATKPYDSRLNYVRNSYVKFTPWNEKGRFVNVGTLGVWSKRETSNVHMKIKYNKSLFSLFNIQVLEDDAKSSRLQFAYERGMYRYAQMTSKIYLLDPRSCAAYLFITRSELCTDFRTFIGDHGPDEPYHPAKLFTTLKLNGIDTNQAS